MSRDIKMCHPLLQEKAERLVTLCEKQGLKIKLGECFRSIAEQESLYEQGRTKNGNIVTNARGVDFSSMHQWGVAFDIIRNDGKGAYNNSDGFFDKVGKIGKSIELEWGGDWKSPVDKPHFQLPYWGSTPKKLKQLYKTADNFRKQWRDSMTSNEVRNIAIQAANDMIYKYRDRVYDYIEEIPLWARPTVEKLIEKGAIRGEGENLELSHTLLRELVINDRMGLYD